MQAQGETAQNETPWHALDVVSAAERLATDPRRGLDTRVIGRIAALAEGGAPPLTPLERRIEVFGRYLMVAALVTFAAFVAVGRAAGVPLADIVMVGVSQVVGLIPEGLPVAMTVALAVGVQRMAKRRAPRRSRCSRSASGSTCSTACRTTAPRSKGASSGTAGSSRAW